jgi:hypothetical protein
MGRLRFLLAVLAGAAIVAAAAVPGASAKKVKPPTKLWYRVHMTYTGQTSRTYEGNTGSVVNNGSWQWLMDSKHAVIVSRGTGKRPDISFSAAMDGELIGYRFSSTHGRPDSPIAGGRLRDCERETSLYRQQGLKLFDGSVAAAPASQGIDVNVAMIRRQDDAIAQLPNGPVMCTREDFDLINPGFFINPRPYSVPGGTPVESALVDLDRGDPYSAGSQPTGVLGLRPGAPFGRAITKTWNVVRDVTTLAALPPVHVVERYSMTLTPCPRGGRVVKSC